MKTNTNYKTVVHFANAFCKKLGLELDTVTFDASGEFEQPEIRIMTVVTDIDFTASLTREFYGTVDCLGEDLIKVRFSHYTVSCTQYTNPTVTEVVEHCDYKAPLSYNGICLIDTSTGEVWYEEDEATLDAREAEKDDETYTSDAWEDEYEDEDEDEDRYGFFTLTLDIDNEDSDGDFRRVEHTYEGYFDELIDIAVNAERTLGTSLVAWYITDHKGTVIEGN